MVKIHSHTDPKKAAAYYAEHLATGSATHGYYSEGEEIAGSWFGKGADMLGLTGPVLAPALERLCDNRRPDNGEALTQRRKKNAKSAYDITISAPKSASVLALVMDDKRILPVHQQAVAETIAEIQRRAMVRVRINGAKNDRLSGNIVGAVFTHLTSRSNDPQIHDHALTINANFDEVEDCWKALQTLEIFRQSGLLTEIYRNRLAAGLHAIGYSTESTAHGMEISGVSREVIELFSKRHMQIDAIAAASGKADSPELRAGIARKSRKAKDSSKTVEQLRADWLAQLSPEQLADLERVKAAATEPVTVEKMSAGDALNAAAEHLYERRSVVHDHDLYEEALAASRGQTDLAALEIALHATPEKYLVHGREVTTPAAVEAEKSMIDFVNAGVGKFAPLAPKYAADANLKDELAVVVDTLLSSPDLVVALHGPAGAGKTTTLTTLVRGLHAHEVIVCAPYAAQVDKLQKDGFRDAQTLERLLTDKTRQKNISGGVIILDEAGLVSVRQLNALFTLAKERGCRIVLSGDSRQHKGVESGDSLRILERFSNLKRAGLSIIWRQTHAGYKKAIHALKDGKTVKGFCALVKLGWVLELTDAQRYHRVGQEYLDACEHKKTCLAVCSTWAECAAVTKCVRFYLQAKRLLSTDERRVDVLQPLSQFTKAQLAQAHRYERGMTVAFNRKNALFNRNESLKVLGVHEGFVFVKNAKGETLLFDPKIEAGRISVFETKTISIAPGEQLLIRRNGKSSEGEKLTNGERVTVKKVFAAGGITLTDGRTIPGNFRHYGHGYAVSSQNSQGKSVDRVLVAIDSESARSSATRETLYVAASRGIERCTIFTDSKSALLQAFQRSGERKAAIEFVKQQNNNTHYEKTNTNPGTGAGKLPIPTTPQPANTAGQHHHAQCPSPGGGIGSLNGNQSPNRSVGNQESGISEFRDICGLPGTGSAFPGPEIHSQGDEGLPPALAL